jgi:type IV pilus assembly protein PilC
MYILTIRWRDELRAQTQWLLMYPAIVAFFVLAAVVFLMSYLVPQMVPFLQNMGQELPLNTKILIAASNAFVTYWLLVLGLPLLILILLASIIRNSALARYFSLMHKTDIPVLEAIEICEKSWLIASLPTHLAVRMR